MKPEINAATEFLSRVFLTHDRISKEKVADFKKHLAAILEERFVDHWHEASPSKGQAFRCIRICPDEALDPVLEKVCHEVGINTGDFQLPMELTLWVDPREVVCKFGDLKCSYHTVAKKDESSGTLDSQASDLDIDDLVENARELYMKKQSVVIHPINSSEMHIPYSEGSNGFTMAIRMNGTMHYKILAMNGANGGTGDSTGYDGSPRGKNRALHSVHHKRGGNSGGFHYYGKSSGGKGPHYMPNGSVSTSTASGSGGHQNYPHHRNNHHHHHHHHHQGHHGAHHHQHHSSHHHQHSMGSSPYSNSYLNGYVDESGASSGSGYVYDQRSGSPTKMNGLSHPPPPMSGSNVNGTGGQITQSSPTPEQIQQQMLHPPPMPPHLQQAFAAGHPPGPDTSTLPPPPPPSSLSAAVSSSSSSTAVTSNMSNNSSIMTTPNGKSSNSSKYPNTRSGGMGGPRNKQGSPAKEMK